MIVRNLTLLTVLAPLLGCLLTGLDIKWVGRLKAQWITIIFMTFSLLNAVIIFILVAISGEYFYGTIYTWGIIGHFHFNFGFMIDSLTAIMMVVVTFISWLVHIYSIGYMKGDPGYQRFFLTCPCSPFPC